ncbi:sugar ABC transporter permease [Bacillus sp. FJAT-50079]|uniref:carbohydrate ABC transporter permease n=1 Tax=Bacillus sp. FJAT-50079 TaxID=2833577 RepID=UPI001BCA635D|nr:sugar ABC transporter permease [Bacillus sp. FJAT-50079]MBS4208150.1 sugar ABC transporter permease [Bacillus sp. FJAT-50079]
MRKSEALYGKQKVIDVGKRETKIRQSLTSKYPSLTGYLFLAPWFIGILVFSAVPMISSLYLSFTNYGFINKPDWVGLNNYINLFKNDHQFLQTLKVTFFYVFMSVPLQLTFSLFVALLLNKGIRGLGIYRSVYYIPSLIGGSVAIAILWQQVFGDQGIVNQFLALFGFDFPSWVGSPEYAVYTIVFLKIWQFGAPMVIFLAGLKSIPRELYEACSIDGAGRVRKFFTVTLPMLSPIILFNTVMQIIESFQAFTPAYIISDGTGGPVNSLLFYTLYIYQTAFGNFQMGYASAMAWILLVIIAIFTGLSFLISKKWVHYGE